jgi:serine-type D-Ala-D-Ala carboxypeptidase (penicillin-binding protein 5/6)
VTLDPLSGGRLRRPTRRRVRVALSVLLSVVAAAAIVAAGLDLGREFGRNFDRAAVLPAGLTPPPGEARPGAAPAVDFGYRETVRTRLKDPPRAGILFDLRTGRVLWSRDPWAVRPIASLTKVMTGLLVVERTSSGERAKVTRDALAYRGSGVGMLPRGRRVRVEALLDGLLLVSGNDAALALADHVAGSKRAFVELMNRRAADLGLRCTHFASPHGIETRNRSCAADLAALTRVVMKKRRITRITRRPQVAVRFPIKGGKLYLNSTNPLLRLRYRGTLGLKTGYTRRAGHSYIGVVRRRGRTLGLVLLDSRDTGAQAKQLFDRAFGAGRERSGRKRSSARRGRG